MTAEYMGWLKAAGHVSKAGLWFGLAVALFPVALALTMAEEVKRCR